MECGKTRLKRIGSRVGILAEMEIFVIMVAAEIINQGNEAMLVLGHHS